MNNYQAFIKKFREDLKDEKRLLDASLLFIEKVANAKNKDEFDYISLSILSHMTKEENQQQLLKLGNYLSDERINILMLCFHYFSLAHDRQEPMDIDVKTVNEALQNNIFYDPDTGLEDKYFKKNLKMYFTLTDEGRELRVPR